MKTQITLNQVNQFNRMREVLKQIANGYMTPEKLRKDSEKEYGIDFYEALEMSYDNIQNDAQYAVRGVKSINPSK